MRLWDRDAASELEYQVQSANYRVQSSDYGVPSF
jgi:hypothetical protein